MREAVSRRTTPSVVHGPATLFSRTIFTPVTAVLEVRAIGSCFRVAKGTIVAERKDAIRHRALHGVMKVRKYRNVNSCFLDGVSCIWCLVWLCGRPPILSGHARQRNHISQCYTETRLTSRTKPAFRVQQRRAATQNSSCEHPN
jgi:hypothetical protein